MAARRPIVLISGVLQELPATDLLQSAPTTITDHSGLTGLANDDHPQYLNQTRGDARYAILAHTQALSTLTQSGATTGQTLVWSGTSWVPAAISATALSAQAAVMTATQASSATALANVTELTLAMAANGLYRVECFVTFQSAAATTGLNLGFTSPTGARCMLEVVVPIVSTAAASALRTTFPNAATATNTGSVLGTGVTAVNSNHTARISGLVLSGATAGNFQVQFASEVSASAVTLQVGSELHLLKLN